MTLQYIVTFLLLIYEVLADFCGENIFCHSPYKCCETKKGCCYDSMLHNSQHFRLQIWNMWYFWFLIIFMMMSCFGGCGYYRRRRLAMLSRSSSPPATRPNTVLVSYPRARCSRSQEGSRQFNFFAYNGPGLNGPEPVSNLPPAYAEVINQPNLYPINKVQLPPYPGNDKPEDGYLMYSQQGSALLPPPPDANLPPPYSEHNFETLLQASACGPNEFSPPYSQLSEQGQQPLATNRESRGSTTGGCQQSK